jgi:hypothetical protein
MTLGKYFENKCSWKEVAKNVSTQFGEGARVSGREHMFSRLATTDQMSREDLPLTRGLEATSGDKKQFQVPTV